MNGRLSETTGLHYGNVTKNVTVRFDRRKIFDMLRRKTHLNRKGKLK